MLYLRNDHPINNTLHRTRQLYTSGWYRLAWRSQRYFRKSEWIAERRAEINQLSWNVTPCGCNLRGGGAFN